MSFAPKSIRAKVTITATAICALVMALVVAVTFYAMRHILISMMSNSMTERLDRAQAQVLAGNYQAAIDMAGTDMMQLIDAHGTIIAETPNARGYSLKAVLEDDEDDDDDEDE
ncbi:MAG: hypothetical protein IJ125_03715, partial [Atopobiaceae bacterium]|nr:hypothetical protein [Atopobiaceae bacterium]